MDTAKLKNHIFEICDKENITIDYTDDVALIGAFLSTRTIVILPIKGIVSYVATLHEIGHILRRHISGRCVRHEMEAWEHAENMAIKWNENADKLRRVALKSYREPIKSVEDRNNLIRTITNLMKI